MSGKDIILFLIGFVVLVLGVFLIVFFWKDFIAIIKGVIGFLMVLIGLIIALFGFSAMKNSIS